MTPNEYTRRAIAVLTAAVDDPHGRASFAADTAVTLAFEGGDSEEGFRHLAIGLINLSTYLLVRLEAASSEPALRLLQQAGAAHAEP